MKKLYKKLLTFLTNRHPISSAKKAMIGSMLIATFLLGLLGAYLQLKSEIDANRLILQRNSQTLKFLEIYITTAPEHL